MLTKERQPPTQSMPVVIVAPRPADHRLLRFRSGPASLTCRPLLWLSPTNAPLRSTWLSRCHVYGVLSQSGWHDVFAYCSGNARKQRVPWSGGRGGVRLVGWVHPPAVLVLCGRGELPSTFSFLLPCARQPVPEIRSCRATRDGPVQSDSSFWGDP